jgi:ABC-2 type transport system permease protein
MTRIWAQARKELTQIVRDRRALVLVLILPVIQLVVMSLSISITVNDLPIVVQDYDGSSASRELADAFRASLTFHVVTWPLNAKPEDAFKTGTARGAVVIPAHFERDLARGGSPAVQVLVDGTDSNTAQLVSNSARAVTRAYDAHARDSSRRQPPVQAAVRLWYNPGRSSPKFYGPGVFVLMLSIFPPLLASLAMAKEGEQKTILQVFVSNISAHEFLLGKILAFTFVGLVEAALMLAVLLTYFDLSLVGDPTMFVAGTLLYTACVATFGTLVGSAIPDQAAAMQVVALFGFLLVFLLSGLIFPVANIPVGLRWVANVVWGRYYIEVVRDGLLQGGGWPAMWTRLLTIAGIGSSFYLMAWRGLRRMQLDA